jgi:hypothetical protein
MTVTTRVALLLAVVLPLVVAPGAGSQPSTPIPQCSPGPASCAGWFTGNVTVSWLYDPAGVTETVGCNVKTITSDGVSPQSCQVSYGAANFGNTVMIRRDATPPQVTGSALERGPDANGWYTRPVAVTFSGSDATSGVGSCDRPTYGGPDAASLQVSGTCRDVAGNTSTAASVALKYDATPPAVNAAPDRAPDAKGWYRRPLTVRFSGSDSVSGLASCADPVRYAGPDRKEVSLAGTCRDAAGNVSVEQRVVLNYDATAPKLSRVRAQVARGVARLGWEKPADAVLVRIERVPGVNGAKRTHVYSGTGERFLDRTVRNGVRYRYEIHALDAAGNAFETVVATGPRPALYQPAAQEVVRAPVVLAWKPVAGARYYNVQLHRNGVKVLSTWPRTARLRLRRSWRFLGKAQSLRPGSYTWYVWPGLGARSQSRYGKVLGSSSFVVKR